MNNKLIGLAAFLAGAAIGAFAAKQYFKKKYEMQYKEDVESVKESFSKTNLNKDAKPDHILNDENKEKAKRAKEKPSIMEYAKMVNEKGYTDYSSASVKKEDVVITEADEEEEKDILESGEDFSEFEYDEDEVHDKPYVIAPDDFGMEDGYETASLLYHADKVLTDENGELLDDPDETIGLDSLNHFGEYEEDSVFVRNDKLKCDFEILLDLRKYADTVKKPPLVEVE